MEPSQFDEFTRAMATPTSRRQAIKKLLAGTFGGLLAFSGLGNAFASGCHPPCSTGLTCCGGKCVDEKKDPKHCGDCNVVCASGLCVNGLCCPPGAVKCDNSCCSFTCCGGNTCTDTQNDKNNCGACGHVCPAGDTCQKGKCVSVCSCRQLCNGTCARSCATPADCPCGAAFCAAEVSGGGTCYAGGGSNGTCTTDCDCPNGYFCNNFTFLCFKACC
jgi:hypothetical protein